MLLKLHEMPALAVGAAYSFSSEASSIGPRACFRALPGVGLLRLPVALAFDVASFVANMLALPQFEMLRQNACSAERRAEFLRAENWPRLYSALTSSPAARGGRGHVT